VRVTERNTHTETHTLKESIGVKSGVALFGETVFTLVPEQKEAQVLEILKRYDNSILIQSEIDNVGARLF